ncbi:UNVERIFIED_CONTAM: hypothetical protein HHA_228070 [Hammondia hammondi]|eukprot:XP_008882152.1 hypothetical protein HHA_228070 [Hammondia hammondi]
MREAELLAAAVDLLALEGERGATFPELLLLLSSAHPECATNKREFQAALWRALYNSPLVFFSRLESESEDESDTRRVWTAAGGQDAQASRLEWRHPLVPPLLPSRCPLKSRGANTKTGTDTREDCSECPQASSSSSSSSSLSEGRSARPDELGGTLEDACSRRKEQQANKEGERDGPRERKGSEEAAGEEATKKRKKGKGRTRGEAENTESQTPARSVAAGIKVERTRGIQKKVRKERKQEESSHDGDESGKEESERQVEEETPEQSLAHWRFSVSAAVRLNALGLPFSPFLDDEEIEKKMKEMPMVVLQAITKRRYAGHWQYQLATDLGMPPKTVFHHLKPLYRQALVTHMQLPLPASARPSACARGPSNLTMSALLWHSRFFDFPRLPSQVQATLSLHHLLPLEHQVMEMLQRAPMHVMLESEVHAFCLEAFTTSERFALASFTAKQFRRLYQKLRGELMRAGRVRRLRAWCPQTQKFEKCLCLASALSHSSLQAREENPTRFCGDEARGGEATRQGPAQGETEGRTREDEASNSLSSVALSKVKQEPGVTLSSSTLSSSSMSPSLRAEGDKAPQKQGDIPAPDGTEGDEPRGDEDEAYEEEMVCSMLAWELPLADQVVMLLEASGTAGLLSIQVARYIGTDNKRAGKIFAELERRKRVWKVAERRGRCFMYRYFPSSLPNPNCSPPARLPAVPGPTRAAPSLCGPSSLIPTGCVQSVLPTQREGLPDAAPEQLSCLLGHDAAVHVREEDSATSSASAVPLPSRQEAADADVHVESGEPQEPCRESTNDVQRKPGNGGGEGSHQRRGRKDPASEPFEASDLDKSLSFSQAPRSPAPASSGPGTVRRGSRGHTYADTSQSESGSSSAFLQTGLSLAHSALPGNCPEAGPSQNAIPSPAVSPSSASPPLSMSSAHSSDALSPPKGSVPGPRMTSLEAAGAGRGNGFNPGKTSKTETSSALDFRAASPSLSLSGAGQEREDITLSLALGKNQVRKLRTPQFERRLRLFIAHLQTEGCATIPAISKVLAKAESSVNGPDRKTVQRMAAVAMQIEPRVAVGGLVKPDAEKAMEKNEEVLRPETDEGKDEKPKGACQRRVGSEVLFYYWTEKFTEEQAHRRVTEMISARRIEGCRLAVQRNERLLSGLRDQQSVGDERRQEKAEQRRALEDEIVKLQKIEEKSKLMMAGADGDVNRGTGGGMPLTMQPEQVHVSPVLHVVAKQRLGGDAPSLRATGVLQFSQKTLALYGFLFPVMVRLKCLHQFLLQLLSNVKQQAASPAGALPRAAPLGYQAAEFLDKGMTIAFMLRKMPLEIFLRTVGCGYRVPFLDKQLSAPQASQVLVEDLPRTVFDILVLSSRQLHLKRQRQQPPTLPLTGNNKRSAPAALRRLLSTLCRMGLVRASGASPCLPSSATSLEKGTDGKSNAGAAQRLAAERPKQDGEGSGEIPGVARWQILDVVSLPAFVSETEPLSPGGAPPEAASLGQFNLLTPGAFEAFWEELQSEVARWIHFNAPLPPSSFDALKGKTGSLTGERQRKSGEADAETRRQTEADGAQGLGDLSRPKVPLPANFPVAEAFSKRNWKGQILLTPYLRAELDAFAESILDRYREAGGEELGRLVFSPHSPEVQSLAARLRIPTDVVLRFLLRLFETRGGIGCGFQSLAFHIPGLRAPENALEEGDARRDRRKRRRLGDDADHPGSEDGGGSETESENERRETHEERRKERERNLLVGRRLVLLHRTRDVRFRCHLCGCLYSLIRALKHHYEKIHNAELPADSDAFVLPWEKEKRLQRIQQAQEQKQLALAFRRKRKQQERDDLGGSLPRSGRRFGGFQPLRSDERIHDSHEKEDGDDEAISPLHFRDEEGSLDDTTASWLSDKTGKGGPGGSSTAAGLLSAAVQRFLRAMRKEDECVFVTASVVAERLFIAAERLARARGSCSSPGGKGDFDACASSRAALSFSSSLTGAPWSSLSPSNAAAYGRQDSAVSNVFGVDGRTLPPASHPVWQILSSLCSATLDPGACMHIFSFLMLRRPVNYRAFNNCRRLAGFELRSHVNSCRSSSIFDPRAVSLEDSMLDSELFALADAALAPQPAPPVSSSVSFRADDTRLGDGAHADRLLLRPTPSPSWGASLSAQCMRTTSLTCRPLNCPRVTLARTVLKMLLFTPLTHYRPFTAFEAAQELREGEWKAVWRVWSLRGWVTHVKQPLPHHLLPPRARPASSSACAKGRGQAGGQGEDEDAKDEERAADKGEKRDAGITRKSPLHALLAAKCRRSFALSAGARAALFGKLRGLRSLSACCHAILEQKGSFKSCAGDSDRKSLSTVPLPGSPRSPHCASPGVSSRGDRRAVDLDESDTREARAGGNVENHPQHSTEEVSHDAAEAPAEETPRATAAQNALESREPRKRGREAGTEAQGILPFAAPGGKKDVSSCGISWREISNASLGVSPASALILLERMAQEDLLLLPGWEADGEGLSPLQTRVHGGRGDEGSDTDAAEQRGDPVEQYCARVCGLLDAPRTGRRPAGDLPVQGAGTGGEPASQEGQGAQREQGQGDPFSLGDTRGGSPVTDAAESTKKALRPEDQDEQEPLADEAADEDAADAEELLDDEDLDRSLLRLLLEGTDSPSGAALPSHGDAPTSSAEASALFASSFLGADGDDDDDEEKARDEEQEQGDRAASLAARIVEGGVTTHLLRLTRGVPRLASLRMQSLRMQPNRCSSSTEREEGTSSVAPNLVRVSHTSSASEARPSEGDSATERRSEFHRRSRSEAPDSACTSLGQVRGPYSLSRRPPLCSSSSSLLPPPGFHLVDGFLGAASEQDAVDPSMFPPAFSRGSSAFAAWAHFVLAASGGASFGDSVGDKSSRLLCDGRNENASRNTSAAPVPEAGSGGFPLCLPEFDEDRKWGWWRDAATTLRLHASPVYSPHLFQARSEPTSNATEIQGDPTVGGDSAKASAAISRRNANSPNNTPAARLSLRDTEAPESVGLRREEHGHPEGPTGAVGAVPETRVHARMRYAGAWAGRAEPGQQGRPLKCPHERRHEQGKPGGEDEEARSVGRATEAGETSSGSRGARVTFIHEFSVPSEGPVLDKDAWEVFFASSGPEAGDGEDERKARRCKRKGRQAASSVAAERFAATEASRAEAGGTTMQDACIKCGVRALHALAVDLLTRRALLPILPNPLPSDGARLLLKALASEEESNEWNREVADGTDGPEPRGGMACSAQVMGGEEMKLGGTKSKNARGKRNNKRNLVPDETGPTPSSTSSHASLLSSASSECCCCCVCSPPPSSQALAVLLPLLKLATFVLACSASAKADGMPACTAFQLFLDQTKRGAFLQEQAFFQFLRSSGSPLQGGTSVVSSSSAYASSSASSSPSSSPHSDSHSSSSSSPSTRCGSSGEALEGTARPANGRDNAVADLLESLRPAAKALRGLKDESEAETEGSKESRDIRASRHLEDASAATAVSEARRREEKPETKNENGANTEAEEDLLSAALGQAFLLLVSLLQSLRFLVVVPGAHDWHLVDAQEAARRYCVRRLEVIDDHVGKLRDVKGDEEEGRNEENKVAEETSSGESGDVGRTARLVASSSSSSSAPSRDRPVPSCGVTGSSPSRQRPFLPAFVNSSSVLAGVSLLIQEVWGEASVDLIESSRRLEGSTPGCMQGSSRKACETATDTGLRASTPNECEEINAASVSPALSAVPGKPLLRVPCVTRVAQRFFARAFFEQRHSWAARGVIPAQGEKKLRNRRLSFVPHCSLSQRDRGDSVLNVSRHRMSNLDSLGERDRNQTVGAANTCRENRDEETEKTQELRSGKLATLQPDIVPVAPWLRLDGRVHASLLQLLALRCWSLLTGKPGSSATEVKDALAILDLADVAFLLQSWTRDGLLRCASLPPPRGSSASLSVLASASSVSSCLSGVSGSPHVSSLLPESDKPTRLDISALSASPALGDPPGDRIQTEPEKKRRCHGNSLSLRKQAGEKLGEAAAAAGNERELLFGALKTTSDAKCSGATANKTVTLRSETPAEHVDETIDTTGRRLKLSSLSTLSRVTEKAQILALYAKTLYFPERAEDVLPEFRDLLLPHSL